MSDRYARLRTAINHALSLPVISMADAGTIETVVAEDYPDGEGFYDAALLADLEGVLALYSPIGGEYLYDEPELRRVLKEVLSSFTSG